MASSNRNWPSMFKSKPTNTSPNQWHHDLNNPHIPNGRNPFTQGGCDDERNPEPKPRWNPRPEQIRILESIFNSGMVNPPREEIRRIRAQLQEYGQVGDANVFYWFQNRKSRSKHKQRHLQSSKSRQAKTTAPPIGAAGLAAAQASSSSSSDKSSPSCNNSNEKPLSLSPSTFIDVLNSPTASVNQPFLHASNQFLAEPFFFPGQETSNSAALTHGIFFPDLSENLGNCSNSLLGDLMQMNHGHSKKDEDDEKIISYTAATSSPIAADHNVLPSLSTPSPTTHNLQGPGLVEKSTIFINDMCFEVANGVPFNVREAFGDDAVLMQSSGQPVPTNEWGVTQQPLQNGAFYYLLSSAPLRRHQTTELLTWYRLFLTSCAMCCFRVLPIFDSLYPAVISPQI